MTKLVDFYCKKCDLVMSDILVEKGERITCSKCGGETHIYIGNSKIGAPEFFIPTAARRGKKKLPPRRSHNHPEERKKRAKEREEQRAREGE